MICDDDAGVRDSLESCNVTLRTKPLSVERMELKEKLEKKIKEIDQLQNNKLQIQSD